MTDSISISKPTLQRLPGYYRILKELYDHGRQVISSSEFGNKLGIDAAQVRKDLTSISAIGTSGVGYEIRPLIELIEKLLGLSNIHEAILVGVGNLGSAIASYSGFNELGLEIIALFDKDTDKIESIVAGKKVMHIGEMPDIVKRLKVKMGIITVPRADASEIINSMIYAGIKAIWNFAPVKVHVPPDVVIRNEDLSVGLATLSYHLTRRYK